jgi:hypothetical protein
VALFLPQRTQRRLPPPIAKMATNPNTTMDLPQDYRDLLAELHAEGAEFVLIGGWAVAAHGHGRTTDDLDVLVRASPANSAAVYRALTAFGAPVQQHGVDATLFATAGPGYRVGRKPLLIEILTQIDGIDFDDAVAEPLMIEVDSVMIRVIGLGALLRNKRAAGRTKDLADVEALTSKR